VGDHGDLRAVARLAGDVGDLDEAVGDLGDLELEERLDEVGIAPETMIDGPFVEAETSLMTALTRWLCS
jgi:hypothetical protein